MVRNGVDGDVDKPQASANCFAQGVDSVVSMLAAQDGACISQPC